MFYVGHFTWEGIKPDVLEPKPRGKFTCIAEVEKVDEAVEKFRGLIPYLKPWASIFREVARVYLDDITEVRKLPEEGVLAHWQQAYGENEGFLATSLPGVRDEFCKAYGMPAEDDNALSAFVILEEGEDVYPEFPWTMRSPQE